MEGGPVEFNEMSAAGVSSLGIVDYVVFALVLAISAAIGVYSYWTSRRSRNSSDFLTAGKKMSALPVSMSLTAGFMTSVTLVSVPAEVYVYGSIYGHFCFCYLFAVLISSEIFLPVFYRLELNSIYKYLELRFNKATRLLATVTFIVQNVLFTGFVIYAPALALSQLTDMNLWAGIILTAGVCIIYCTMGGLKAVIWTDVFQIIIMLAGYLAIMIRSLMVQGGISTILTDSQQGGRLNAWDFDPNPMRRHTFWTILIGGTVTWVSVNGTRPAQIQRYVACKSVTQARIALHINLLGLWAILLSAMFAGLCIFSVYKDCDPLRSRKVSVPDELLPYLVKYIMAGQHGLVGLFISAVYSGSLSTVSSSINSLAAVTLEDLIKPYTVLSEKHLSLLAKGLTFFYGVVCIAMAGLASVLGQMSQAVIIVNSFVGGPLLALFSLGILCPFANTRGALLGVVSGFIMCLALSLGHLLCPTPPDLSRPLPLTTEGCNLTTASPDLNWTSTVLSIAPNSIKAAVIQDDHCMNWHSPSYLYFGVIGAIAVIVVGMVVSLLTGGWRQTVDPKLMLLKEDTLSYHLYRFLTHRIQTKKLPDKQKEQSNETFEMRF